MLNSRFDPENLDTRFVNEFCDRIPGGFFVYKADEDEKLIYANQAVYEIFGCDNEEEFRELTGYTFRGIVHPFDYAEVSDSIIRQIAASKRKLDYVEYRIIRKDGSVRWVNDYGHYNVDPKLGGLYYVFISDITKKREDRRINTMRETVIQTLTRFYHTVWVINDVETEHWTLYYADSDDGTILQHPIRESLLSARYTDARVPLVNNMVAEEDRERVRYELSLPVILEKLKNTNQFSLTFLRRYDDGTPSRYFRIDVGRLEMTGNRMGVTFGFKDVDKEYRALQEADRARLEIQKAKEENKRLSKQIEVAKGISALVDSATSLFSNIPAMAYSKTVDTGTYTACNQAFADFAGKSSPEEVVGLTDYDLFDEETARRFIEDDKKAVSMDKPYVFFEDIPDANGTGVRNLQKTKVKYNDAFGRFCTMGMNIDITEMTRIKSAEASRKELERRLELQDQLLKEQARREEQDKMITALASNYRRVYHVNLDSDDAVCYRSDPEEGDWFPEGVHFPFSENFEEYAHKYIDKIYIRGFLDFIEPKNIRNNLAHNNFVNYRYLIRRLGREYYEMISAAKVDSSENADGEAIHSFGLGLTVVDAEMRESIAKNEALAQALASAKDANKAKSAFLSNMSHEIRTPMNAIIGLDSLALRDDTISEQTRDYLEKIKGSANHLMGLINDILDMSRIESGRIVLRKEEFSFRGMLSQINTMVMSQCSEKGLKYECKLLSSVSDRYIGDDMKLKQILINILGNAVKFTEAPGSVTLSVERLNVFENQSTLKFCIKDTGIGISESFIPKIFKPFTQENGGSKNRYGSTGLGMAITRNIVELMNGTISVESQKGVGSEFTVIVTLKNAEEKDVSSRPVNPGELRVLIVDNDKTAAEQFRLVLDEAGIYADICFSGKEAMHMLRVNHIKHEPYNLVLMDWIMRGMDGLEIAAKIRKQYDRDTTMILITSHSWHEILDTALSIGIDGFLQKPVTAEAVLSEFERIARRDNINVMKKKGRADLSGKRILMAEDLVINAEILKQLMTIKGALIDHAENGRIALEMFANSEPFYYNAILMDIRMPEMDGLEAAEAIRALDRPDAQKIPIIALTANAFDEDVQRSLQVGMNAHLSKPVEPEHLYTITEELIWEADHA